MVGADGAVVGADHCGRCGAGDGDGIAVVGLENLNSVLVEPGTVSGHTVTGTGTLFGHSLQ